MNRRRILTIPLLGAAAAGAGALRLVKRVLAVAPTVLVGTAASMAVATSPAMADGVTVAHKCGNPSRVFKTVRAAICADLVKLRNGSSGPYRLAAMSQAYCQSNLSPYTTKNCRGIVMGADLYRRKPGASAWQLVFHSDNYGCGSPGGEWDPTCAAERLAFWSYEAYIDECWEFMGTPARRSCGCLKSATWPDLRIRLLWVRTR